ncbi:MAG: PLP-dependent aminotransferase family protein [Pseudomonadota bacterium]
MATEQETSPAIPLYEALATQVADLVSKGVLTAGRRAPSLRKIAAQHGVSLSTALQAYRLLEDRGLLEARPKSGFFVTHHRSSRRAAPAMSEPSVRAYDVRLGTGITDLLEHAANPDFAPLGCAIPSAELLAAGQLDRFLARAARTKGTRYNVYTEPRGDSDLRLSICRRAARHGQVLSPSELAITCGCTEAITLALQTVAKRGDTIAIESPTYFGMLQILQANGFRALELATHADRGIDLAALETALGSGKVAACLLSSSFNNPLGSLTPDDSKRAIIEILSRHRVPLIEDDIYGDIHFGRDRPKPFTALAPDADILYCSSFSKTVAPGYRIGWIAAPRRIDAILNAKFASTLCGPALPQLALADYLESGGYDSHLRRIRRAFANNIDHMTRAIDIAFPAETRVTKPSGGFVLWLEMPKDIDTLVLYEQALAERICFAPGSVFSATGRYRHCLRLSCGSDWNDRLERSVARLGTIAADLIASSPAAA